MPYVTQSEIEADIPYQFLVEALDDNRDGKIDTGAWDKVAAAVGTRIDSLLAARYTVPFTTVPPLVKRAAYVFALETLYRRRGVADEKNPWSAEASELFASLKAVAKGDMGLDATVDPAKGTVEIITEDSRTVSASLAT